MKQVVRCILPAILCSVLSAGPDADAKQTAGAKRANAPTASATPRTSDADLPEIPPAARVVQYGERDVVPIKTRLRYTTLIVLPKNEQILDFTCGDKEYWVVNGNQNFAYVKPAKAGARTNLNLITASGNIYSFALADVSEVSSAQPDLKVFVELQDSAMASAANNAPRFVPAQVVDDYRHQVEIAKEETRQVKQSAQAAVDNGVNKFVSNVRYSYRFEAGKKPFFVRAMYHDDKFTYIHARPEETPTLYEVKDGQPNVVTFQYRDGVYVIDKVIDQGYLAIGKKKLAFVSEE
jgi:type IV secretory pathway VirB9-like protein